MATHIKQVLGEFLKQAEKRGEAHKLIQEAMGRVLDKQTRQYLHLQEVYRGRAVFLSKAAGATYNLELQKDKLLAEIQKALPEVNKLVARAG